MTGLTALNPFFLWLLPLASLPILFHLFVRVRKQSRPFPTLMFFHRIDPRLNSRRRLREWLILLLRALLIALLISTLARPTWFGLGTQGPVAVVLVLDNSGSMSGAAQDGSGSRLKTAIAAAGGIVSQLRGKDSAGIVLFANDPTVPLPAGLTSDKTLLRNALDHVEETEAVGSVAAAIERATALLERCAATHFEVHILSDLQEFKWSQPPANLRPPRAGARIVIHRLAAQPPRSNVSLTGARLLAETILPGRRLPVEVHLTPTTPAGGQVRLNWLDDSGNRGAQDVAVPAPAEKTVSLELEPQNAGFRWASFWIEGDDFGADNRVFAGFVCADIKPVLFGGPPEDFGQLPLAVSPGGNGKRSGQVSSFDADWTSSLRNRPAQFLVLSWDSLSADAPAGWTELRRFLDSGGGALLAPSARSPENLLSAPQWLGMAAESLQTNSSGSALVVLDKLNPMFNDLRDAAGVVALRNVKAFKFHPLRLSPGVTPVLGIEDGRVTLAEQRIGKGRLLLSGIAFDSGWSTLPLKPGFIAMAQNMSADQGRTETNIIAVAAGESLRLRWPDAAPIHVQSLAGSALDWKGRVDELPSLPRSGVYAARRGDEVRYVTVRSSEKEGRQQFMSRDELPALGKLAYGVENFTGNEALISEFQRLEKSLDLSRMALVLAFAALLAEGWLANPPPIKAKGGKGLPGGGNSGRGQAARGAGIQAREFANEDH